MEKSIVHEIVPEFDQQTQYVVELDPVELEDCIFIGCEVRTMEIGENSTHLEFANDDVVLQLVDTIKKKPIIKG